MPQPVIRDYIPQGEEMTEAERARLRGKAAIRTGASRPDFVPGEGHVLKPPGSSREHAEEALERALARQEFAAQHEFSTAQERLRAWNVGEAIAAITVMPLRVQEMYLVAEFEGSRREGILDNFPQPDPAVVEQYAPKQAAEAVADEAEAEPVE